MKRRQFIACGLGASAVPLVASLRTALAARSKTALPASETLDSSQLVHNLRYEGVPLTTSTMRSTGRFDSDAQRIKEQALAALNSGMFQTLRVVAGGHSYIGASVSQSAYVLNMAPFTTVVVDPYAQVLRVGAGCKFHHLSNHLARLGGNAFIASGDCPTVGVSGYSLGGGISLLSPMLGLGVDRVTRATMIVLARSGSGYQARVLEISPRQNAELFWAAMGGGAHLGIVTDLSIRYDQLDACSTYQLRAKASQPKAFRDLFLAWEQLCESSLHATTSAKLQLDNFQNISISGILRDQTGDLARLQEFAAHCGATLEAKPLTMAQMYETFAGCKTLADCATTSWTSNPYYFAAKSTLLERAGSLSGDQLEKIAAKVAENSGADYAYIQFMRWNGAMRASNASVSFPHREVAYECQVSAKADSRSRWATQAAYDRWVDATTALLGKRKAAYFNHVSADIASDKTVYFGQSWPLLQEAKAVFDPDHIFDAFKRADEV